MRSLQNRLFEGFFRNAGGMACPSTKEALENEEDPFLESPESRKFRMVEDDEDDEEEKKASSKEEEEIDY